MSVSITIEFPELDAIKKAFRDLPPSLAAKYMGSALTQTLAPSKTMLRTLTPRGPTGNLRRAIATKVQRYTGSPTSKNPARSPGAAVALLGYRKAPKGRRGSSDVDNTKKGSHAGFLEFGTKVRRTDSNIASSFRRSGRITVKKAKRSGRVTTSPKPPKGFFKAVPVGQVVDLGEFPIGGKQGLPPIKTTFDRSLSRMRSALPKEMTKALNNALRDKFGPFGKMSRGKQ